MKQERFTRQNKTLKKLVGWYSVTPKENLRRKRTDTKSAQFGDGNENGNGNGNL